MKKSDASLSNFKNRETKIKLLAKDEPNPYVIINKDSSVPLLLVCDHASERLPRSLGTMGLDSSQRKSHIAIDIGVGDLVESLAENLGLTAVLCQYSRLIVDCNRNLNDPTAFIETSDGIDVTGNHNLDNSERIKRIDEIYWPYHNAIESQIKRFVNQEIEPIIVAIHSFTPTFNGKTREWELGVLWDQDPVTANIFLRELRKTGMKIGDNQPYSGKHPQDFTIDFHAETSQLQHVGIEVRQDLLKSEEGITYVSNTLQNILTIVINQQYTCKKL
tara:strand:+ start:23993 stop:24817 length:825 start_codon:yes stop_codon:yes gene_type:complete